MSTEVEKQKFQCAPPRPHGVGRPAWKHNALHDLESVWWIAVWVIYVFRNEPSNVMPNSQDSQRFGELFPPFGTDSERDMVTVAPTSDYLESLSPSYSKLIWEIIAEWRIKLTESMKVFQAMFQSEPTEDVCSEAYNNAIYHIKCILQLDGNVMDAHVKHVAGQ